MKKQTHFICHLTALIILSGCSTTGFSNDQAYQFGEATQANIAKHAVEPDAALKENTFRISFNPAYFQILRNQIFILTGSQSFCTDPFFTKRLLFYIWPT